MSAQGLVPAARTSARARRVVCAASRLTRRAGALGLSLGLGAGAAACARGDGPALLSKTAPDAAHAAVVRLVRCDAGWCQSLAIGERPDGAQPVATLTFDNERCDEIVWARDGKRVGFLINGYQLRVFDAFSHAPAGQLDLVPADSKPTTRIARGVTFSDNGAAITFDDCPRDRSGCRPGMVAMQLPKLP